MLDSFPQNLNAAIIGASGGIGSAFAEHLKPRCANLYTLSRADMNIADEKSIAAAAEKIKAPLHLIIVATGVLHTDTFGPEKSLRDLGMDNMRKVFEINTFGPALLLKHFLPKIPKDEKSVFAALSAKVGSISDNGIGGWHSYRASKAALNMMIKGAAIETARRYKMASIIGLHPGTVATNLSAPFRGNVQHDIFTPAQSASMMLDVINEITPEQSGRLFAYDGKEIAP